MAYLSIIMDWIVMVTIINEIWYVSSDGTIIYQKRGATVNMTVIPVLISMIYLHN